jgi:peptide/nickel transport system substrate-binding protein
VAPSFDPAEARRALEVAGWTDGDGDGTREKNGLEARVEICSIGRQVRLDTVALVIGWLKEVGIQGVLREADPDEMFAPYDESTESTPCALRRGNFDLAIHSMTASVDPGDYYFEYHSSQLEPDGANDAGVNDIGIDVALETARNSVHPAVIRDGMAEFEKVYVERTAEIPLYFSQAVDLRGPKVGNVVGGSPLGGATWNAADWFVKS